MRTKTQFQYSRQAADRAIILSAKLVAPNIDDAFANGYDWIIDTIKASPHAGIANELEIAKAIQFLKTKDFQKVRNRYQVRVVEDTDLNVIDTSGCGYTEDVRKERQKHGWHGCYQLIIHVLLGWRLQTSGEILRYCDCIR